VPFRDDVVTSVVYLRQSMGRARQLRYLHSGVAAAAGRQRRIPEFLEQAPGPGAGEYELKRFAQVLRNQACLAQLQLTGGIGASLGGPAL
jgi:hypothetical protein